MKVTNNRASGTVVSDEPLQDVIPTDYHRIPFDEWLDIFLQYALIVADQGEPEEAYDSLAAAADASVYYNIKPKTRLIHVCWFSSCSTPFFAFNG